MNGRMIDNEKCTAFYSGRIKGKGKMMRMFRIYYKKIDYTPHIVVWRYNLKSQRAVESWEYTFDHYFKEDGDVFNYSLVRGEVEIISSWDLPFNVPTEDQFRRIVETCDSNIHNKLQMEKGVNKIFREINKIDYRALELERNKKLFKFCKENNIKP